MEKLNSYEEFLIESKADFENMKKIFYSILKKTLMAGIKFKWNSILMPLKKKLDGERLEMYASNIESIYDIMEDFDELIEEMNDSLSMIVTKTSYLVKKEILDIKDKQKIQNIISIFTKTTKKLPLQKIIFDTQLDQILDILKPYTNTKDAKLVSYIKEFSEYAAKFEKLIENFSNIIADMEEALDTDIEDSVD